MNRNILWPLLLGLGACQKQDQSAVPAAPLPPPVTVQHPVEKEITEWDEFTGRLAASEGVKIYSQVTGYLQSVHFQEGTEVKKGEILFQIDPRPFEAVRDQAAAQVDQASIRHELAESEMKRATRLIEAKAISQEEFDNKSQAVKEAAAGLRLAEAALKKAQVDVEYCTIKSPMDGRIGLRLLDPGALVVGGPMGATELAGIVKLDPIYAYIDVDEQSLLRYHRLMREGKVSLLDDGDVPCEMALADSEGFPYKGKLDFAANELDPATGTITMRAVFSNPKGKTGLNTLQSGYFVRVRTQRGGPHKAMLVPDIAVASDQASRMVMVVNDQNLVEQKRVEVGPVVDGERVILSGLTTKDRVVVNGMANVHPGAPVAPEEAKSAFQATKAPKVPKAVEAVGEAKNVEAPAQPTEETKKPDGKGA